MWTTIFTIHDPRRIEYAGSESDGPKVDYKTKYAQQQQVIRDNFAHFDVPYNGADNNDYVDGKGFSETDGSLEGAMLKAARSQAKSGNKSAGLKDNFQQGDGYEKYQFFYHPDHLGSSSFITDTEGEVVQHIEYVPYGEVFIEERNNVWNSPYLFNAKEFDEETGLYYYGARYYDPKLSLWLGVDPMAEKYPNMGVYVYCANNPVKLVDPDGNSPTLVTAAIGAVVGGVIGGAIEIGTQLYQNGEISDWKAVGGASAQGAIVGGVAGLTCGASLAVSASSVGAANAVGGTINRVIQDEETSIGQIATDAAVGAVSTVAGKLIGGVVSKKINQLSPAVKGKIGEKVTELKYKAMGYSNEGKALVSTGRKTATGREEVAKYDFLFRNNKTDETIIVESKFNKATLTPNQKRALQNVPDLIIDRTTSGQIGEFSTVVTVPIISSSFDLR